MKQKIWLFIVLFVMIAATSCKNNNANTSYTPPATTGGTLKQQVSTDEIIKQLKTILKEDPSNLNGWIKLGNTLMDSKRFSEAIQAYSKALELDPSNTDVRVDMGTCYRNIGKPEIAINEYKKALQYDPNHIYAHRNMAVVLAFDLNRPAEAIREFEIYLKLA
ncbi:MAG: tetratricopeptide repeat protein, partial [Nitrospirae bacterium]|nr:tetratricopeptide repeat protein [Nitrospirota bacterium]